jgi:catechol 2,3-dioxygenase-like lactoylglutathione lyase family enzyme
MKIRDIAYVRYQATNLEKMEKFLVDFGLHRSARTDQTLFMRTMDGAHHAHVTELGEENRQLGFGFFAESEHALHAIAARVGAPVEDNPDPGGGLRVRTSDPSGFIVDVLFGQQELEPLARRAQLPSNNAHERQRLGLTLRMQPTPSQLARLGHIALHVSEYSASKAFYEDTLGMRASDVYYDGSEDNEVGAFMNCGRGEQWTDHHTVGIMQARDGCARFDHCAFEVIDLDDVIQGGAFLMNRGHRHSWGIGRHVQGSQIFDYWRDPFGNKLEHWTDGDLVNANTPIGREQLSDNALYQWGPVPTQDFFA